MDSRLLGPPVPPVVRELWHTYMQLAASRRTGMGMSPLTLADIDAWQRLHGVRLTPWELDTVIDLDAASMAALAKQKE